jgi:exopolysaccharide biosynthesis polyprenyl glycosylphosphotransferase
MNRQLSVNTMLISMGLDAIIIAGSLLLAVQTRPLFSPLPFIKEFPITLPIPNILYLIFPAIWVTISLLLSVYDPRKNIRISDELIRLLASSILASGSIAGILYLFYRDFSRFQFFLFVTISFLGLLLWRLIIWQASQRNRKNHIQGKVLLVGISELSKKLQSAIDLTPELKLQVIGYLDDNFVSSESKFDILGQVNDATEVIHRYGIEDVIITLPRSDHEKINRLAAELNRLPVKVWLIPDYLELALYKAEITNFAGIPMLDLRASAITDYQRLVKRFFDLAFTICILPICILIMGLIALMIWLEDKGPVLFKQKRVGENGRLFQMYKFRSMVINAEELRHWVNDKDNYGRSIHKIPDDPRVTRTGRFLRRRSLDELPQLLNILKGEMSWVGPRPELPELVEQYEAWQWKRFTVPQGITGWWQINGRSDKPMHLHTEDDLYYIQNYSIWLDILILFKSIGAVIRGTGAF